MKKTIRIGNAGGFWGDDLGALKAQLTGGPLDYVTMDFLAEITMSILQRQKDKDPELGYATDFLGQMEECLPLIVEKKVTVISNAGGINPLALGRRIIELAKKMGLSLTVGVVDGDDIRPRLDLLRSEGEALTNMETGERYEGIAGRVTSANVYLGAEPVVAALKRGCRVIVTGRVTDTGITVAPMIHEFGWKADDWDKIAAGVVAGHIIECGAQSSGGNITDWQEVPTFDRIGYPIIEMKPSGEFVVTKHKNTGGLVSEKTVKEQLVYEMGDPAKYITPDGIARFDTIQVEEEAPDRVRVFGIRGEPMTEYLKVSMSYDDGWKASGTLLLCGPDVAAKAEATSAAFWNKLGVSFEQTRTEAIGSGSIWPAALSPYEPNEIFLRLSVRDTDARKINQFGKQLSTMILAGPSGMAVTGGGRPRPSPVVAYWPCLIHRSRVTARVTALGTDGHESSETISFPFRTGAFESANIPLSAPKTRKPTGSLRTIRLGRIAYGRSGDKGDTCNVGVLARSPQIYQWLVEKLTADKVKRFFDGITLGEVERYELPNLLALNFLLHESLGGGGTRSLMVDPQGKTLAQALMQMTVRVPESLLKNKNVKKS